MRPTTILIPLLAVLLTGCPEESAPTMDTAPSPVLTPPAPPPAPHCQSDLDCPSYFEAAECTVWHCDPGQGDADPDVAPGCAKTRTPIGGACNNGVGVCAYPSASHFPGHEAEIPALCVPPGPLPWDGHACGETPKPIGECWKDADCNDGNPCTAKKICLGKVPGWPGECAAPQPEANGTLCDVPATNESGYCVNGACCPSLTPPPDPPKPPSQGGITG